MNPLYQAISDLLIDALLWQWSHATRHRLLLLLMGILLSKSTRPSQMAKGLCQYGISDAQESSVERQIRRIMNDEQFTQTTSYHPFIRSLLHQDNPRELTCIIDATTHTDQFVVLMVAVYYRGRAIPLAWDVWHANVPLKGARFWERVKRLLQISATLIPPTTSVTWLADRAFGTPQFTDLVVAHGWHFVVRVQGQTRFQDRTGYETRIDNLVQARARFKAHGLVFKSAHWRAMNVVVWRSRHHRQLLCLVSDLDAEYDLVVVYRQRFAIETLFRDYKSHGWQWEKSLVVDIDHTQRILIGMALASLLCLLVGSQVGYEWLSKPASGNRLSLPREAKHSLFQHGLTRLLQWACHYVKHRLNWCLMGWDRHNWQALLRHHYVYPAIFARRMGSYSVVKVRSP
jgi:hypothetical protein